MYTDLGHKFAHPDLQVLLISYVCQLVVCLQFTITPPIYHYEHFQSQSAVTGLAVSQQDIDLLRNRYAVFLEKGSSEELVILHLFSPSPNFHMFFCIGTELPCTSAATSWGLTWYCVEPDLECSLSHTAASKFTNRSN